MPLWASWLRDFDILNLFYDKFKSKKMAKFETLLVPRGLGVNSLLKAMTLLSAGLCYTGLYTKDTKTGLAGMAPYTAAHTAQESRLRGFYNIAI